MNLTGSVGKDSPGLKKRIAVLLEGLDAGLSLSMGEIIGRLDLDKALASEVSSALYKLRAQGSVSVFDGAATSERGKRVVRRYVWVGEAVVRSNTVKTWDKPVVASHPLDQMYVKRRVWG